MQIDCGVCTVRPWQHGDESPLARHANSREIWLNLRDQFPHPYTVEDATAWVELVSAENPPTHFAIVLQEAVGGIGFTLQGDIARASAEIGYWLSESHWNKGVMTAAVRAVTDYAFTQFSLTRVFAVPYARNIASHRVLEKVGYTREGVLRRSAIKDGTVLDQVIYAMTDRDRESA
jgi:[ribosomal protein S5]-alanine N-acetyltransferase